MLQHGADPNILSVYNHRPIDLIDKDDQALRNLILEYTHDTSFQPKKKASFHQLDDVDKIFHQKFSLKAS